MSNVPPPPPPPGGDLPPPPPATGPAPSGGVPIGDAYSWGWKKFTENVGA